MAKKFVLAVMLLMLCVGIQNALALGSITVVTKGTQAEMGLHFTLVAEHVDAEAVLVRMEIPRKGTLKNLRSVNMRIGPGRPLVAATLQTAPGKKDVWVVTFQLAPDLADKCSIDLIVPSAARTYAIYAVELKGYVTDRK